MNKCEELINHILEHYRQYISAGEDLSMQLTDPVDKKIIGSHYGETHLGSAYIIAGIEFENILYIELGEKIIKGFLCDPAIM